MNDIENYRLRDWDKINKLPDNTIEELGKKVETIKAWTNTSVTRNWNEVTVNSLWGVGAPLEGGYSYNSFSPEAGDTILPLSFEYESGNNVLLVFVDEWKKQATTDYEETDDQTITFLSPFNWTELVEVVYVGKGEQWIKGDKGDKGDQWEQGIQGEQGIQWEKWDKGDQGIQGVQWETWPQGEKWDTWDEADEVIIEYSIDWATLWHPTFAPDDLYIRTSTDWGVTFSDGIKFVWDAINYLNSYKAPQLFNPDAWEVTAGTATFTLSGASDVGIVTVNGQTLDDSEYSLTSTTLTVTPDNWFSDTTDEVLVYQVVLAVSSIPTGWASYNDTQYTSISRLTIPANTPTKLPNNSGNVIDFQKPTDVSTFYDSTTQKILGRNGDWLGITIFFYAIPSAQNQYIDCYIDITWWTGTPANFAKLYPQTIPFPKGSWVERGITFDVTAAYTLWTWEANWGDFYVESNAPIDIYWVIYNFNRNHKAA